MELNSFCEKIMLFFDGYFLLRICTDNWSDGFNVTNSKLPIEKESHTETQMICPDDYVRRYNVVIVLSKQRTMKERTNLVDKIVFEYEKFRNWSDWQRKDETSSIILKAKKREKKQIGRDFGNNCRWKYTGRDRILFLLKERFVPKMGAPKYEVSYCLNCYSLSESRRYFKGSTW